MKEHIVFIEASLTGSGEKTCQYAHRSGREVSLVCKDPRNYHEDISDHVDRLIIANTNNSASIIEALEPLNRQSKIDGIMTTNDFYVVIAAEVAEHFGLPTTPSAQVATAKNKYLMRQALAKNHVALNPAFILAKNLGAGETFASTFGYPFIAKPQDANDSLHVKIITNHDDLETYFEQRKSWEANIVGQSFADGVLLENVIGGEEFCLDLLKPMNQPFILMGAFCKKLAGQESGHFIKIGASFPADQDKARQLTSAIVPGLNDLGIKVGAVNVDCKLVDGQVKILEINPRLVGDQMGSHMIELATGQNPAHAVVELALGHNIHWHDNVARAVAIHRIVMPQAGYFYGIGNANMIAADNSVAFVNELGVKGKWYDPARSNQDVIGSIIAVGDTPEKAMQVAQNWAQSAQVVSSRTHLRFSAGRRQLFHPTARGQILMKDTPCDPH